MKLATLVLLLSCCAALAGDHVTLTLDVPAEAREEVWSRALAVAMKADSEVALPFGRADVVTDDYAIEVDRIEHFHGAIGQALHYGDALGLKPVVAFIAPATKDEAKLIYIERLCYRHGVTVWVLAARQEVAK